MTKQSIRTLEIGNFKSIDSLQIQGLSPFSVFAGANGSGKSNFIDALDFVSTFVRHGIDAALQRYGGIKNIRSRKRAASKADRFDFKSPASSLMSKDWCQYSTILFGCIASTSNRNWKSSLTSMATE